MRQVLYDDVTLRKFSTGARYASVWEGILAVEVRINRCFDFEGVSRACLVWGASAAFNLGTVASIRMMYSLSACARGGLLSA